MLDENEPNPRKVVEVAHRINWIVFFRNYGYILTTRTWNSQFSMVHHHMFANSARTNKQTPEEKSVHFDSKQCELSHIGLFKHWKCRSDIESAVRQWSKTSFCFLTATIFDARKNGWCVPYPCFAVTSIVEQTKLWDNTVLYHHA